MDRRDRRRLGRTCVKALCAKRCQSGMSVCDPAAVNCAVRLRRTPSTRTPLFGFRRRLLSRHMLVLSVSGGHDYYPAPKGLAAFPDVQVATRKTSVKGVGGLRKRRKTRDGTIFEWAVAGAKRSNSRRLARRVSAANQVTRRKGETCKSGKRKLWSVPPFPGLCVGRAGRRSALAASCSAGWGERIQ